MLFFALHNTVYITALAVTRAVCSYSYSAVLWPECCTTSSWRRSRGCVSRAFSSTSCSLRCSKRRSRVSSSSTSLATVSATTTILPAANNYLTVFYFTVECLMNVLVCLFISKKMPPYAGPIWHYPFSKFMRFYWPDNFLGRQSLHKNVVVHQEARQVFTGKSAGR